MDRLVQRNVLALSGRAVEAAGDVNTLLLDKTGTITLGNRQASELISVGHADEVELADAAQLSSLADETPEGRSVVVLVKERYGLRARQPGELAAARWVPFSAQTRMSGVDLPAPDTDSTGLRVRKGAAAAVLAWVRENGGGATDGVGPIIDGISAAGGTPLVVAEQRLGERARALGVIHLKDVVKTGMQEGFDEMRRMGIRTVMITGDNPLTARAIAAEAGADDFLAEASPEDKMALIKAEQQGGKLVAMTGDGTNDAPALAQADVGVAMNTGTSAAKLPGLHGRAPGSLVSGPASGAPGSRLIGQAFVDKNGNPLIQYFQSRPSAAGDGYDPTSTSASNLGPEDAVDTLLTVAAPRAMVDAHTSGRLLGFLGEPTVNVLELNLDLDRRYPYRP
jgi:potassium-transporting ATPase ATP-binding subunit